jgi:hypothetical protein
MLQYTDKKDRRTTLQEMEKIKMKIKSFRKAFEKAFKIKKETIKAMNNIASIVIILLGIFVSFYGINHFWAGFHNTDICHNVTKVNLENNLNYIEKKIDGTVWTADDCYVKGLTLLHQGFWAFGVGMFILSFGIFAGRDEK